jgi:integrase
VRECVSYRRHPVQPYDDGGPLGRIGAIVARLVFIGAKGAPLRRSNFRPIWAKACTAAGVPGLHFHDLRHTGGTLVFCNRGDAQGTDGPAWALQSARRDDLPARDTRP